MFVERAEYQAPTQNLDDNTRGQAVTIGQPGPLPEIELELDRTAREYAARETIQAQNFAATNPDDALVRSLQFERDRAIQTRNAIIVSISTDMLDVRD